MPEADVEYKYFESGAYEIVLPLSLETPEVWDYRGVTWKYVGQWRFNRGEWKTWETQEYVVSAEDFEPDGGSPLDVASYGLIVDDFGREWQATSVDEEQLQRYVEEYDRLVEDTFGREVVMERGGYDEIPDKDYSPIGTTFDVFLDSSTWTRVSECPTGSSETSHYYGGSDSRTTLTTYTARQKKAVMVIAHMPGGAVPISSGVMVDSDTALIAEHSTRFPVGNILNWADLEVCTMGNTEVGAVCRKLDGGGSIIRSGKFVVGSTDYKDKKHDYTLLHLDGSMGVGWMALSEASNSTLKDHLMHRVGFPIRTGNSCENSQNADISERTNAAFRARFGIYHTGWIHSTPSKRIETDLSSSGGESGAATYYYPDGCCGSHYVTGVNVGRFGADGASWKDAASHGPKARSIRSWVIANK